MQARERQKARAVVVGSGREQQEREAGSEV